MFLQERVGLQETVSNRTTRRVKKMFPTKLDADNILAMSECHSLFSDFLSLGEFPGVQNPRFPRSRDFHVSRRRRESSK